MSIRKSGNSSRQNHYLMMMMKHPHFESCMNLITNKYEKGLRQLPLKETLYTLNKYLQPKSFKMSSFLKGNAQFDFHCDCTTFIFVR